MNSLLRGLWRDQPQANARCFKVLCMPVGILLGFLLLALPASAEKARVRLAVKADTTRVWVGQRLNLRIDLFSTGFVFSHQQFSLPAMKGVLVLENFPVVSQKLTVDYAGESWQGLRYEFPIFVQRPGSVTIPKVQVSFDVSGGYGSKPQHFRLHTQATVVRAEAPPGVTDLSALVTTKKLTARQRIDNVKQAYRIGDAITRSISLNAVDVPAMLLVPTAYPLIKGIAAYPADPVLVDSFDRGSLTGKRLDNVTYVLQSPGTVRLPALAFQWWDPVNEVLHTERVPALEIFIAAGEAAGEAIDMALMARWISSVARHPWAASVLMISVVVGLMLMLMVWRRRAGMRHKFQIWRSRAVHSECCAFLALMWACRTNRSTAAYDAFSRWWLLFKEAQNHEVVCSRRLQETLIELQLAVIAEKTRWRSKKLRCELKNFRKVTRRERGHAAPHLAPLNPA